MGFALLSPSYIAEIGRSYNVSGWTISGLAAQIAERTGKPWFRDVARYG
jgi:hypothetical protein